MPPKLTYRVSRYSKHAVGGPKEAVITATGNVSHLWQLMEMLRCGVRIYTSIYQPVWWGYVHSVDVDPSVMQATITCKGWWQTLGWRYYFREEGLHAYLDSSDERQNFGEGSNILDVAQQFQALTTWQANKIGVLLYKQGSPTDDLTIEIREDLTGEPTGAVVTSGTIPNGVISTNGTYVETNLTFNVQPNFRWFRIRRNGANDPTHYYQIVVNSLQGYPGGRFKYLQTSVWNDPNLDAFFRITGQEETTTQIKQGVLQYAQAITATDIIDTSAVNTMQFRDGESTLKTVVEDLLAIGNASGRRLLARVEIDRRLTIYLEPLNTPENYYKMSGSVRYGVSMDDVGNRIQLAYSATDIGVSSTGSRFTTGWNSDTDSQSEYFIKDMKLSANDLTATAAQKMVDTALTRKKYPQITARRGDKTNTRLYGTGGEHIRLDTCPVGVWMRLVDVSAAVPTSVRTSNASVVFVEEAEYDAESDTYTPTPRGSRSSYDVVTVNEG